MYSTQFLRRLRTTKGFSTTNFFAHNYQKVLLKPTTKVGQYAHIGIIPTMFLFGGIFVYHQYQHHDWFATPHYSINCDASPVPTILQGCMQAGLYLWGTNVYGVIDPQLSQSDPAATHVAQGPNNLSTNTTLVKYPRRLRAFDGMRLRHVAICESSAAVIDEKGDLYQWGAGFTDTNSPTTAPVKTVIGQDLVRVSMSPTHLFVLSKNGTLLMLPISADEQAKLTGIHPIHKQADLLASKGWMSWVMGRSQPVHQFKSFTHSKDPLIGMDVGHYHLTVVTKNGQVLTAPINTCAFQSGCLGRDLSHLEASLLKTIQPRPQLSITDTNEVSTNVQCDLLAGHDIQLLPVTLPNPISQVSCGAQHTIALSTNGRAYTWGSNSHGQLGLGNWTFANQTVQIPSEIHPNMPNAGICEVAASGNVTALITRSQPNPSKLDQFDVWTCGNGQYGSLGTGLYNHVQPTLSLVRYMSGKMEYNEHLKCNMPIRPHDLALSPTHAACLLGETPSSVLVWGSGAEFATGIGSRKLSAIPTSPLAVPRKYGFRHADSSGEKQEEDDDVVVGEQMILLEKQRIQFGLGVSCIYDQA